MVCWAQQPLGAWGWTGTKQPQRQTEFDDEENSTEVNYSNLKQDEDTGRRGGKRKRREREVRHQSALASGGLS